MFATATIDDLFQQMDELRQHMDLALSGQASPANLGNFPPVNIFSNDDQVLVTTEMPGVDPSAVEISAYRDTLTLKGERVLDAGDDADERPEWHRRERSAGKFTRTLRLPYAINPDSVQAKAKDGVLCIVVQRPEADKPRRIPVDVA